MFFTNRITTHLGQKITFILQPVLKNVAVLVQINSAN